MSQWRDEIARRLAEANLDPARESEVAQELEQHLDDRYAEMLAAGRSESDARRAAIAELREDAAMRRELSSVVPQARDLPPPGAPGGRSAAEDGWQDVRYALRMLRRHAALTAVAVITLALGIGATVAIGSTAYAVLYRPLPLAHSDALVVPVSVNDARNIRRGSIPYADYSDWREQRDVFAAVAVVSPTAMDISGDGTPERVPVVQAGSGYFDVFEARTRIGRVLADADYAPGASRVVVISAALWARRFGSDPGVLDRDIRAAGTLLKIVGVVDAASLWPTESDMWVPLRGSLLGEDERTRRDNMIFQAIARLGDGVPLAQARARVASIAERVAREHPESRAGWTTELIPVREYVVNPDVRLGMLVLLGGVGLVLLIACVNLANLLLARGADRAREMALRAALGASRRRLVRQMMTEALVLAAAGGAAGVAAAHWLIQGLKAAVPPEFPLAGSITIDGVALAGALALTVASALVFGVFPALTVSAHDPVDALREGGRTGGAGRRTGRLRDALVVAQIALAIILLIGGGLMLRSFAHLMRVDPGVDVDRILSGRIALPAARYTPPMRAQFYERLTDALASSPGVESAAATSYLPAGGRGFGLGRVFLLDGQAEPPATADHPASWNVITPEYFRTVGIRLVRGRTFTRQDTAESTPVMIINQTMARRVFGDGEPLGRRLRSWRDENLLREIVGVVADVRYSGLADDERSLVYVPHRQNTWGALTIAVRASGDPALLADTLRHEVARLDPDIAVARVRTLSELAGLSIAGQRFGGVLLALFAAAAALLAAVGVYGVMSYAVAQRRHEFGVRLALGARPSTLVASIIRRSLALAGIGTLLGVGGGLALAPLLRRLLIGVTPTDPVTLVTVVALIIAVALAASAIPARRAADIHPLDALRE